MDEVKLARDIKRTRGELSKLTGIFEKSPERYQVILGILGDVFEQLYAPRLNATSLKHAADLLQEKAMRLNDSGDNLDVKDNCKTLAMRLSKMADADLVPFVKALKETDISEFISFLTSHVPIQLGSDPEEAAIKRKEVEEAERRRRDAEEAERKRREAEEEARRNREAEEQRRRAEEAHRKAEEERRRKEAARRRSKRVRNFFLLCLAAVAVWWFWLGDFLAGNQQPDAFVYVENLTLRSTPETGSGDNALDLLKYGTPVKVIETYDEDWVKVKADGKTGYVASFYLMEPNRFQLLDSIWEDEFDPDVRQLVPTAHYRLALLDFLERDSLNPDRNMWRLVNNPDRGYNNVSYPDLRNGYDIVPDFAFVLKNPVTGKRQTVLYSIDVETVPVFIREEEAPDAQVLKRVNYNRKKGSYSFEYVSPNTKINDKSLIPDDKSVSTVKTESSNASSVTENVDKSSASNEKKDTEMDSRKETSGSGSDNPIFDVTETIATFPDGHVALMKWLSSNTHYPEAAQQKGVEGRVVVKFVIEKDGSIREARILKGVDKDLDREALRVVNKMPKWIPGKNGGVPVRSYYSLPVTFKLQQ